MSNEKKPVVAAGEELIERCPFSDCGKRYQEPIATDVKQTCPACERSFNVMTYSN